MIIELKENDYVAYFWTADNLGGDNFNMMLRRRDNRWLIDCRFRYVRNDKVFDSADEKSFYHVKCKPKVTETQALEICREIFHLLSIEYYVHSLCLWIDGGSKKFLEIAKKYKNLFHVKEVP